MSTPPPSRLPNKPPAAPQNLPRTAQTDFVPASGPTLTPSQQAGANKILGTDYTGGNYNPTPPPPNRVLTNDYTGGNYGGPAQAPVQQGFLAPAPVAGVQTTVSNPFGSLFGDLSSLGNQIKSGYQYVGNGLADTSAKESTLGNQDLASHNLGTQILGGVVELGGGITGSVSSTLGYAPKGTLMGFQNPSKGVGADIFDVGAGLGYAAQFVAGGEALGALKVATIGAKVGLATRTAFSFATGYGVGAAQGLLQGKSDTQAVEQGLFTGGLFGLGEVGAAGAGKLVGSIKEGLPGSKIGNLVNYAKGYRGYGNVSDLGQVRPGISTEAVTGSQAGEPLIGAGKVSGTSDAFSQSGLSKGGWTSSSIIRPPKVSPAFSDTGGSDLSLARNPSTVQNFGNSEVSFTSPKATSVQSASSTGYSGLLKPSSESGLEDVGGVAKPGTAGSISENTSLLHTQNTTSFNQGVDQAFGTPSIKGTMKPFGTDVETTTGNGIDNTGRINPTGKSTGYSNSGPDSQSLIIKTEPTMSGYESGVYNSSLKSIGLDDFSSGRPTHAFGFTPFGGSLIGGKQTALGQGGATIGGKTTGLGQGLQIDTFPTQGHKRNPFAITTTPDITTPGPTPFTIPTTTPGTTPTTTPFTIPTTTPTTTPFTIPTTTPQTTPTTTPKTTPIFNPNFDEIGKPDYFNPFALAGPSGNLGKTKIKGKFKEGIKKHRLSENILAEAPLLSIEDEWKL